MNDSYHIYFKGEILFKNLSKDEFEFVWGKLYTSYINALNKELTYELISENNIKEYIQKNTMYRNPFYLGWNKGWSFLFFLEGGIAKIEAKGFGISITTKVKKGESPLESADRLVSKEQRIRKSRYYSWIKSINEKTIN